MLALAHGYGLSGSGSNLWTREVARALCENGTSFHLVCQESHPERYPWVAEAIRYGSDGVPDVLFERATDLPGRCTLHRPDLRVLPAFVRPQQTSAYVFSILDLDDDAIEDYIERNARVLEHLAQAHGVTGVHVNHVVLLSEAARRAKERAGLAYAVMPHGSAIEYIVKKSDAMHGVARRALDATDHVFTLNGEIRGRLRSVFPGLDLQPKTLDVPVGVDTSAFRVVPRAKRPDAIERLAHVIRDQARGKTAAHREQMRSRLHDDLARDDYRAILETAADYDRGAPDEMAETRLRAVDWTRAETVLFVGRVIQAKGAHSVVAAFPSILAERPGAVLLVAGAGPLREPMEAFLWALRQGYRMLARNIVRWGSLLGGDEPEPLHEAARYLDRLEREGRLDTYFAAGRRLTDRNVVFTGFMDHDALCHLYPCGDVGVFPSVVKEASPMVIPEAAAAGCVPVGTDFAGTADSLGVFGSVLPGGVAALLRVSPAPEETVDAIARHTATLLAYDDLPREALRRMAVERYDWHEVARRISEPLAGSQV